MTFEELKQEADKQGYALLKRKPPVRLLPCVCGCGRRHRSYYVNNVTGLETTSIVCNNCKRLARAVGGERNVREAWNRMIEEERSYLREERLMEEFNERDGQ